MAKAARTERLQRSACASNHAQGCKLALVPQPKTLVEAAVQLALLFNSMGYELDTDDVEEMRAGFKKPHRTTAGLARAVAAAAGVDLTEFGELDMVSLMHQKCPELGPTEHADQHPDVKW